MLDPTREVPVSAACGARVFHDADDPVALIAVPTRPRVATDEQGRPAIRLVVLRRREPPPPRWMNASLTLTTSLELTDQQRACLRRELDSLLPPAGPAQQAPSLVGVTWTDGRVHVQLLGDSTAVLEGTPSLVGRNECALSCAVTEAQLPALLDAWRGGLPAGSVTYELVTRAAAVAAAQVAAEESGEGAAPEWHTSLRVAASVNQATPWAHRATAAFDLRPEQLEAALQIVDL